MDQPSVDRDSLKLVSFNALSSGKVPDSSPSLFYVPACLVEIYDSVPKTLLDSGATDNFVDQSFLVAYGLEPRLKKAPDRLMLADGNSSSLITHEIDLTLLLGEGFERYKATFGVTQIGTANIVLGLPFLRDVNPVVDWATKSIKPRPSAPVQRFSVMVLEPKEFEKECEDCSAGGIIWLQSITTEASKPEDVVPVEYHDLLPVFSKRDADKLPPHRSFDHRIPLVDGQQPSFGPIYSLSISEQEALREYLDENLAKGFIVPSESPAASPILFVKKKDGSLRLCVDYRKLNAITVKNRYPLPLIGDLIDQVRYAKFFSKIDLRGAYNLLRIAKGEEWKTAFRTRHGLFEYRVMPFGLTNAPASFQHLMNHIFRDMLDVTVVVYLDDILVFSRNKEEHVEHVREVLRRLLEAGLYAKHDKCEFHMDEVEFLGFRIGCDGVKMDTKKVESVVEWPEPKTVKEVQSFLGFANFYRRFIEGYAKIARPLHDLTRKGTEFVFDEKCKDAFDGLKRAMSTGPVLRHFDPELPIIVETDASDFALGAVLSQREGEGTGSLRPVAYASRSLVEAERNYPVHDKETLAIVWALLEWRHYLEGAKHTIQVLTDHRSLEYFMTTKLLTRRQARWGEFLADFDFVIKYRPGTQATRPDALSRRADYHPRGEGPPSMALDQNSHNLKSLLSRTQLLAVLLSTARTTLDDDIRRAYETDKEYPLLKKKARLGKGKKGKLWTIGDGLLVYSGAKYVPESLRLSILADLHDAPHAGHPGQQRTYNSIRQWYWWPGMKKTILEYVERCSVCQRDKTSRQKPMGFLKPLPTAQRPWGDVSCDFIGKLPESDGYNAILVIVDRLTKMGIFIPTTTKCSAEDFADLFFRHVYSKHGLPDRLVTDRGSLFTSKFWRTIARMIELDHRYSSAYHPQTDGQTEIVNQWLEQYIRMYVNREQSNWAGLLYQAEIAYNSTPHTTTGVSPLFAYSGSEPRRSMTQPPKTITGGHITATAEDRVLFLKDVQRRLKETIELAQQSYKKQYDKHRRAPDIKVGDKVYLSTKNLSTLRPSPKLEHRYLGPYPVIEKINDNAYRLELPPTLQIHPVFPVSLLRKSKDESVTPEPAHAVDNSYGEVTYEIEGLRAVQRRYDGSRTVKHYLVKWVGFPEEQNSWSPEYDLKTNPKFKEWVTDMELRVSTPESIPERRTRRPTQRLRESQE